MSNRTLDRYMEQEYIRGEYSCCDCGYRRGAGNHPGIRCPVTGRCGQCGNDWPCEDHAGEVPENLRKKVDSPSYVRKPK